MTVAVRTLRPGQPGWPARLARLAHPPRVLHLRGTLPAGPAVAVVGARRCSLLGAAFAHRLGADLAAAGVEVISGMALGIDAAAHQGALAAGGRTTAVLGCGIDVCYPRRHHALREEIAATGCVMTEFEAGEGPIAWHFPTRNRLIAALADAVVVVEAGERSGALGTVQEALAIGVDVLAVPGHPANPVAAGCVALLRDGAAVCTAVDDVLAMLDGTEPRPRPGAAGDPGSAVARSAATPAPAAAEPGRRGASPAAMGVLAGLSAGPAGLDTLAAHIGIAAGLLNRLVSELELRDLVRRRPGGRVEVTPTGLSLLR